MKLLSLRYFVTVAEQLNFTKAAEYLYVSQPTLSRLMMELEDELEVMLFIRVGRGLQLTESGELLYQQAKKIIELCDNLKKEVQPRMNRQETIRIGYQAFLNLDLMDKAMNLLSTEHPYVDIALTRDTSAQLVRLLAKDELDVVFTIFTCVKDMKGVESIHIQKNNLQIAVPNGHPLSDRDTISVSEIADENYVMLERRISPTTVDYFVQLCVRNGFSPRTVEYFTDIETGLQLVKLRKGITILNSSRGVQVPEGVCVLNLKEAQNDIALDYVTSFKRDNPNGALPLFVSTIMSLINRSSDPSSDM